MKTQNPSHGCFSRGSDMAATQRHFPSDEDLVRGDPFFCNDFQEDLRAFCEYLQQGRVEEGLPLPETVVSTLDDLNQKPSLGALRRLAQYLDEAAPEGGVCRQSYRRRCQYYLAAAGDPDAAGYIAGEAAMLALVDAKKNADLKMFPIALSWAAMGRLISALSESADLHTSISSVDHLRRRFLRTFEGAMASSRHD